MHTPQQAGLHLCSPPSVEPLLRFQADTGKETIDETAFVEVLGELTSQNRLMRSLAIAALNGAVFYMGDTHKRQLEQALAGVLPDRDPKLTWRKAILYCSLREVDPAPLVRLMADEDPQARAAALYAISRNPTLAGQVCKELNAACEDPDPCVAALAAYALCRTGNCKCAPAFDKVEQLYDFLHADQLRSLTMGLFQTQPSIALELIKHRRPAARMSALDAISTVPEDVAIPVIMAGLSDDDETVQHYAVRAVRELAELPDELLSKLMQAVLDTEDDGFPFNVWKCLTMSAAGVLFILDQINKGRAMPDIGEHYCFSDYFSLKPLSKVEDGLFELLSKGGSFAVPFAGELLGKLANHNIKVEKRLLESLTNSSPDVHEAVLNALQMIDRASPGE